MCHICKKHKNRAIPQILLNKKLSNIFTRSEYNEKDLEFELSIKTYAARGGRILEELADGRVIMNRIDVITPYKMFTIDPEFGFKLITTNKGRFVVVKSIGYEFYHTYKIME